MIWPITIKNNSEHNCQCTIPIQTVSRLMTLWFCLSAVVIVIAYTLCTQSTDCLTLNGLIQHRVRTARLVVWQNAVIQTPTHCKRKTVAVFYRAKNTTTLFLSSPDREKKEKNRLAEERKKFTWEGKNFPRIQYSFDRHHGKYNFIEGVFD